MVLIMSSTKGALPIDERKGGLTVTRRAGQTLVIGEGDSKVYVTALSVGNGKVKLHTQAPEDIPVDRLEVREQKIMEAKNA